MMQSPHQFPDDERLGRVLREWRVDPSLPPRFEQAVWQRIAREEEGDEARGLWPHWQMTLRAWFARPAVAVAFLVALLLLGSGAGWWQAQLRSERWDQELGARYVQSVSLPLARGP